MSSGNGHKIDGSFSGNTPAAWRRLLSQSPTQARAVLQRVLDDPLTFTPDGHGGYTFAGPTRLDKLFAGLIDKRPAWLDPNDGTGCEEIIGEIDGTYGRLLEAADDPDAKCSGRLPLSPAPCTHAGEAEAE